MSKKEIIKHVLVVLWCLFIFFFSQDNGIASDGKSRSITKEIIDIYEKVFPKSLDKNNKTADTINHMIRKTAHFTIYFILGILVLNCTKSYKIETIHKVLLAILFCILYATTDEIHQLFIDGRGGRITDVLIDSIGSSIGILCMQYIVRKNTK